MFSLVLFRGVVTNVSIHFHFLYMEHSPEINEVSHLYGLGALFQALICLNFMCSDFHFSDHNK